MPGHHTHGHTISHRARLVLSGAGCILALACLPGCSNDTPSNFFDALGAGVDPYASAVQEQQSTDVSSTAATTQSQPTTITATPPESQVSREDTAQAIDLQTESHTEGEQVNIEATGPGSTVYARWTLDGDGDWAAVFTTNNGSTIYSYLRSGSWYFYSIEGRQIIHTTYSSLSTGLTGPYGEESYWQDAQDPSIWY